MELESWKVELMRCSVILFFSIILICIVISGCLNEPESSNKQNVMEQTSSVKTLNEDLQQPIETATKIINSDARSLIEMLNDSNKSVKITSIKSLDRLFWGNGSKEDPDLLLKETGFKENADPSLKAAIQALIIKLNDNDNEVRAVAAKALGDIGDRSAIEHLITALKDNDSGVRASAAKALGNIGVKAQAEYELRKALSDTDQEVKRSAEAALIAMKLNPYPAPPTGTFIIGREDNKKDYQGRAVEFYNHDDNRDAVFEFSKEGIPYIKVYIRSKDSYWIPSRQISPGSVAYVIAGNDWDPLKLNFTRNIIVQDL